MQGTKEQSISESSHPSTLLQKFNGTIGLQLSGSTIPADSELTKRVPSRILNPLAIADNTSFGCKGAVPTTTMSAAVQVIDLTTHGSSDKHPSCSVAIASSKSLMDSSQLTKDSKNYVVDVSVKNERTGDFTPGKSSSVSSSAPTKGYCYCLEWCF